MKDIAKKLDITEPAVSMALRGYPNISPETTSKVRKTAKALGYRPNLAARNLRRKQSKVVGFVFPDLSYQYSQRIVEGAKSVLGELDYTPMITLTSFDPKQEEKEIDVLLGYQAEGVICLPTAGSENIYKRVVHMGVPLVFVGNGLDVPGTSWIGADGYAAASKIMHHLVEQGHTKIACVITDTAEDSLALKSILKGYLDVVDQCNLVKDDRYMITSHVGEVASADKYIKELMSSGNRPTAIFSISDPLAYQVLDSLNAMGLRTPEDCAVTGIGDLGPSSFGMISLTTVREDAFGLGVIAAQNLIEQMNSSQQVPVVKRIEGDLIVRRSSVGHWSH